MVKHIRKWGTGDPLLDEIDWNDMTEVLQHNVLSHNHKGGVDEGVKVDHADLSNVTENQHHAKHLKTLDDHLLSIIPVMDDAHIPDVETLSYTNPFALLQIPDLPTSKVTSGRFLMARLPDDTLNYLLSAKGSGVDPAYVDVSTTLRNEILKSIQKFLGVYWFNNHWLPTGMMVVTKSGSAGILYDDSYIRYGTGATSGSYIIVTKEAIGLAGNPTWEKNRHFGIYIYFYNNSNQYVHIVTGSIASASSIVNAAHHIGFKVNDNTLYGTVGNGANESTLTLGTISAGWGARLEVVFKVGVEARFYINGEDKGAIVTNLPIGPIDAQMMLMSSIYNTEAVSKQVDLYELRTLQEE